MKLRLRKVMGQRVAGLVPADRAAELVMEKLPMGKILRGEVVTPQSIDFQGLMFATFELIANVLNSGPGAKDWDQDSVRRRLLIMTGNADTFTVPTAMARDYGLPPGLPVVGFQPRSMAWASMPHEERSRFFDRALAYVLSEFGDWCRAHPDWSEIEAIGAKLHLSEPAQGAAA